MKTCAYKDLYTNVHSNFIHNGQKLETIQMSINWTMDKQIVVYTYMTHYYSKIKETKY